MKLAASRRVRPARLRAALGGVAGLALGLAAAVVAAAPAPGQGGWIEIDYGALVDRRVLSHSGESVEVLLRRLGGRPVPPPGERPGDRLLHALLDPLVEPYAFVLPDAMASRESALERPWIELGSLWAPGQPQPAWVELLRARRWIVESDGAGRLRAFLPGESAEVGVIAPVAAAERAWRAAWPVLRHACEAERRRLGTSGALALEVYAYVHRPERSRFDLGVEPWRTEIRDTRSDGRHPPLDLEGWRAFLDSGLRLEGARLEPDGGVRLLGSRVASRPTLAGRPVELADLAVAYRAVFYGGLAEPYMSLDRGFSPQTSLVNYGGRLRDTSLGLVSLLCDIRFKTFSLGLDILEGSDLRERLRRDVPDFRTHLERLAADPQSAGMAAQQTRLWFYPDDVDLTLSRQGDVLVLRRVRMTAASERVADESLTAAPGEDPPWTRATVAAINQDYDALAAHFPELGELDQVVRLLALFTWLEQAASDGWLLPDLDALMALELPARPTPRTFPQLLAYNALPEPGSREPVAVFDRVDVAEALDRLNDPATAPLDAGRRLARAREALDARDPQHAALLAELERADLEGMSVSEIDLLVYRAERLRMHRMVLATLGASEREGLAARQSKGEELRVFSVGIGGLDLGMGQAVSRAAGRALDLGGEAAEGVEGERRAGAVEARETWRAAAWPGVMPVHGLGETASAVVIERRPRPEGGSAVFALAGADAPEVRSRRLVLDAAGRPTRIERLEGGRRVVYAFTSAAEAWEARPVAEAEVSPTDNAATGTLPADLVLLHVVPAPAGSLPEPGAVRLRLVAPGSAGERRSLETDFPRAQLQRLVLGPAVDLTPGRPIPALAPPPPSLAAASAVMVVLEGPARTRPWEPQARPLPGEEHPARLAAALGTWWSSTKENPAAIVGVDAARSPERWSRAPALGGKVPLLLPREGFEGPPFGTLRPGLAEAWTAGPVLEAAPERIEGDALVLVSAEAPEIFARRLRSLATSPALAGKLLVAWTLAGPVRGDVPAGLLADGRLAGLGLADASVLDQREAAAELARLAGVVRAGSPRPERAGGPFLWYF